MRIGDYTNNENGSVLSLLRNLGDWSRSSSSSNDWDSSSSSEDSDSRSSSSSSDDSDSSSSSSSSSSDSDCSSSSSSEPDSRYESSGSSGKGGTPSPTKNSEATITAPPTHPLTTLSPTPNSKPTITAPPTRSPTQHPTPNPTERPTQRPTQKPTPSPTRSPTKNPTPTTTPKPTRNPTPPPTPFPTQPPATTAPTSNTPFPTSHMTPSPSTQTETPSPTPGETMTSFPTLEVTPSPSLQTSTAPPTPLSTSQSTGVDTPEPSSSSMTPFPTLEVTPSPSLQTSTAPPTPLSTSQSTGVDTPEPSSSSTKVPTLAPGIPARDCDAIAAGTATTEADAIERVVVDMDLTIQDGVSFDAIATELQSSLQETVAPAIAGCDKEGGEVPSDIDETRLIVNVLFGKPAVDPNDTCTPPAGAADATCVATDTVVDVYYIEESISKRVLFLAPEMRPELDLVPSGRKLEDGENSALEMRIEDEINDAFADGSLQVPGLVDISEVNAESQGIITPPDTERSGVGLSAGGIVGIVLASLVLVLLLAFLFVRWRQRQQLYSRQFDDEDVVVKESENDTEPEPHISTLSNQGSLPPVRENEDEEFVIDIEEENEDVLLDSRPITIDEAIPQEVDKDGFPVVNSNQISQRRFLQSHAHSLLDHNERNYKVHDTVIL